MSTNFVQLGSVAEFINGAAFKPEDWNGSGARIIRIQNLTDPSKPYNRTDRTVDDKLRVRPGDLLVSWSATLGVFEWMGPDDGVLNQHIFRVVPDKDKVAKNYLRHALEGALVEMQRHLHGATMQHVNRGEFLATKLFLPTLAEQRRIAEVLDRAEALRAKRRAALAQLDTLTQSIFLDLFGYPAANPKALRIESLGDHLTFVTSGGRGWAEFYAPAGRRFIRSFDVQMNHIGNEDPAFVLPPENAEARRTRVMSGDVLLTITGSRIGRVAPVPEDLSGAYISQHVAILRVDPKRIEPTFLSFFLSFEAGGQRQIAKAQYGQTKPGLNFEQIRRFQVPVPPLPLQHDFARRVAGVEKLKTAHRASLAELNTLVAALQFRGFRGEL
jgi:type I restriction enzyme S subunit